MIAEVGFQMAAKKSWLQYPSIAEKDSSFIKSNKVEVVAEFGETVFNEIPSRYIYQPPKEFIGYKSFGTFKSYDGNIHNFEYRKGREVHVTARVNSILTSVFDVKYKFDRYSRRLVENQDHRKAKRAILAFGCSFTFGEGLGQGMDYPSQLAEKMNDWQIYNFGFLGFSTNDVLDVKAKIPNDYLAGIDQEEGVFAWWFIPDHLTRFFCKWNCYHGSNSWMRTKSEYVMQDGQLIKIGSFEEGIRRKLYKLLSESAIVKRYGFSQQPQYNESELKTFVHSLDEIVRSLKGKKFLKKYIMIDAYFEEYPLFKKILLEYGFTPIEYFQAYEHLGSRALTIVADGHPSSENAWIMSEVLKNRIYKDLAD